MQNSQIDVYFSFRFDAGIMKLRDIEKKLTTMKSYELLSTRALTFYPRTYFLHAQNVRAF